MSDLWNKFVAYITSLWDTLPLMISDIFIGIFDDLMGFANSLLAGLSLGLEFLDITTYLTALPVQYTQVMGLIGITQISTMIVTSLGIRLILQLIPFTRLGS